MNEILDDLLVRSARIHTSNNWASGREMEFLLQQPETKIIDNSRQYTGSFVIQVMFKGFRFFHTVTEGAAPWWATQFPLGTLGTIHRGKM